ncbi:hypothetical protein BDI4_560100 [Burkholderia diffusa]|nr:hypothetical protein BDI4_560100 [Burkholderia diffusa]
MGEGRPLASQHRPRSVRHRRAGQDARHRRARADRRRGRAPRGARIPDAGAVHESFRACRSRDPVRRPSRDARRIARAVGLRVPAGAAVAGNASPDRRGRIRKDEARRDPDQRVARAGGRRGRAGRRAARGHDSRRGARRVREGAVAGGFAAAADEQCRRAAAYRLGDARDAPCDGALRRGKPGRRAGRHAAHEPRQSRRARARLSVGGRPAGPPAGLEAMVLVREGRLRYDRPLVASTTRPRGRRRSAAGIRARSGAADRRAFQATGAGANAPASIDREAGGRRRPPGGFRIQQQRSVRTRSGADRTSRGTT